MIKQKWRYSSTWKAPEALGTKQKQAQHLEPCTGEWAASAVLRKNSALLELKISFLC